MDGSVRISFRNRRHLQCIDINKATGLPLPSDKPLTKQKDIPDLPSNSNLAQAGTTTGIPNTASDKGTLDKQVEEIPASSVGDVPQADTSSDIQGGSQGVDKDLRRSNRSRKSPAYFSKEHALHYQMEH